MSHIQRLFRFPWRSRRQIRDDVDAELAFHLERQTAQLIEDGLDPAAARERAIRQFGDITGTRRYCRTVDQQAESRQRRLTWLFELGQDIRLALRVLARHPGFTWPAVGTLAVALAATAIVASFVRFIAFQPTALSDPEHTVFILGHDAARSETTVNLSYADIEDWRIRSRTLEQIGAYRLGTRALVGTGPPRRVLAVIATRNLMSVTGTRLAFGRRIFESDPDTVAVISHRFWVDTLGSTEHVIGATLRLDGRPHTVVGVLESDIGLNDLGLADVWVPLGDRIARAAPRDERPYRVVGRLRPSATLDEVQAELTTVSDVLAQEHPTTNRGWGVKVLSPQDMVVSDEGRILLALLVALAALVMFVATLNVGGLMMARLHARQGEVAVRSAVGAGPWRLIRQFAVEGLMVAGVAGALGAALATGGFRIVTLTAETTNPFFQQMRLDPRDVATMVAFAALSPLLFALLPVWRSTRRDRGDVLTQSRAMAAANNRTGSTRTRRALVAAELGVATLLVIFAGLWLQTATALRQLPNGFTTEHLLTLRIDRPETTNETPGGPARLFFEETIRAIGSLPGVRNASVGSFTPVQDREPTRRLQIDGRVEDDGEQWWAVAAHVGSQYLSTLQIPIVSGRSFTDQDIGERRPLTLVNQTLATTHWSDSSPVGARIRLGTDDDGPWLTVIGVTGDIRNSDRDQPPLPYAYVPYTRAVADAMAVFVRTDGEPTQIASAVREAVSRVDATQPVYAVRSMAQVLVDDNLAGLVLVRVLVGLALVAIALATSGVYAILSYAVGRRTSEIGVRIALGATRQQSVGLVVRDGLSYAVVGVTLGMLGAWGAARLSASQLFGVTPSDPATFLMSALVILFAVTAASWAPARAAARLSPLTAMRRD